MQLHRQSIRFALPAFAFALLAGAAPAAAQGRQLFEWSGRVDREVQITMRGREATVTDGRFGVSNGRISTEGWLPRERGEVTVRVEGGRGNAWVVQQPSNRNDYTTIVRVRDTRAGNGRVRVQAYWRDADGRFSDARNDGSGPWGRVGASNDRVYDGGYDGGYSGSGLMALRWSGEVDDAVEIRIQGGRISYNTMSGGSVRRVRTESFRGLPREDVDVMVDSRAGRGSIQVIEQPTARNGYSTVIRILDPRSGADDYAFDLRYRERNTRRW